MNDRSIVKEYLVFESNIESPVGVVDDYDVDDNEDNDEHKNLHEIRVDSHLCSLVQIELLASHLTSEKIRYYNL